MNYIIFLIVVFLYACNSGGSSGTTQQITQEENRPVGEGETCFFITKDFKHESKISMVVGESYPVTMIIGGSPFQAHRNPRVFETVPFVITRPDYFRAKENHSVFQPTSLDNMVEAHNVVHLKPKLCNITMKYENNPSCSTTIEAIGVGIIYMGVVCSYRTIPLFVIVTESKSI